MQLNCNKNCISKVFLYLLLFSYKIDANLEFKSENILFCCSSLGYIDIAAKKLTKLKSNEQIHGRDSN